MAKGQMGIIIWLILGADGGQEHLMIDIGFVNGEAETRFFRTGLMPEVAIVNV